MSALCLVRHGLAGERGPQWPDDRLRPLTAEGRAKMKAAAAGLATLIAPQLILTSPLVRAAQTAEIVADALPGVPVRTCDALANGDHAALLAEAAAAGDGALVVAVGHEPSISEALSWLLTGDASAATFDVKKGAAALVTFAGAPAAGAGTLEWLLPPKTLRALSR
jgi:phosphohistidine phosphatase